VHHLPLSSAQLRLWFLDQLEPGGHEFNLHGGLRFRGPLEYPALARSLDALFARHESLRTHFESVDGTPRQVLEPVHPRPLPQVDLTSLPAARIATESARIARVVVSQPFDLNRGPVFRSCLVRLAGDHRTFWVTMHHIVSDAWSMGVLFRELAIFYAAFRSGKPHALDPLPVQYPDFALWQQRWLNSSEPKRHLDYWRKRLADAPEPLELAADRPRLEEGSSRGAQTFFRLDAALARALKNLSRTRGVTLFMTLLAGFATLLYRLSGQRDLLIGSPIANRNRIELEGLIGFFINTLVLRFDLEDHPDFTELLSRVSTTTLEAYEHQDFPFERLVEELQPQRHLNRQPFFQVLFQLQNAPAAESEWPELGVEGLPSMDLGTSNFDLTLSLSERGGEIAGTLQYSTDLFDASRMARWSTHFTTLLSAVCENPERRLGELPLLTPAERHQLCCEWNDRADPATGSETVQEKVRKQALRAGDVIAVRAGHRSLSYGELDRRARHLATRLGTVGLGPGARVGVLMDRGLPTVIALLGVLEAGACCVPMDPEYPASHLARMLRAAQASLVLGDGTGPFAETDLETPFWVLEEREVLKDPLPAVDPGAQARGQDLVYLLFTSGSTGLPKGVAMPHRTLAGLLDWQRDDPESGASGAASTLQFAPMSFDVFFQEVFSTWDHGGTLVLVEAEIRRDPEALLEHLLHERVERIFLPFIALEYLAEAALRRQLWPGALRQVITAGEQLKVTPALLSLFQQAGAASPPRLYNHYGPTESHVVTCHALGADAQRWRPLPSIGRPIPGARAALLDRHLEPVAIGIPGQLFLGGRALARGYHGRPALTAERFLPDPLAVEPGGRLYHTGDLAVWRTDGRLDFLGRSDHQVKVRGFRVEPGEIEGVLSAHLAVHGCAVVATRDGTGETRLVAWYTSATEENVAATPELLRAYVAERLPGHLVPAVFESLDSLPVTPSGKLDRASLARRGIPWAAVRTPREAPLSPHEELVAGVWGDLLDGREVGRDDDFFALGGHSLLATRVVARLRQASGVDLPVRVLFEAPTVRALAVRIERALRAGHGTEAPALVRRRDGAPSPLSYAQQRLWFLDRFQPEASTSYNLPFALRMSGPLHTPALAETFREIERRHEILRTTFPVPGAEPVQVVGEARGLALPVVDLSAVPESLARDEGLRCLMATSWQPFDLSRGPSIRLLLVRLGVAEHLLSIAMHHIIGDGWSASILLRELRDGYRQRVAEGARPPLPELPVQYADFARWQREWLDGEVLEHHLDYWRNRLAHLPALELATDFPRAAVKTWRGALVPVAIAPQLEADLRAVGRSHGATLFIVLMAAFHGWLFRHTAQRDLAVGFPIANRQHAATEGLIGCFVNTLVLRVQLDGATTPRQLLAQVRESTLEAHAQQDLPFEKLVEELEPDRDLSRTPLFQVMLSFDTVTPGTLLEFPGLHLEGIGVPGGGSKFDLTWALTDRGTELSGVLEYNPDLFAASTATRMAGRLRILLESFVEALDRPLWQLPLLTPAEWQQVVTEWSGAAVPRRPFEGCLHDSLEAQQARAPHAIALLGKGHFWSYRHLERRANGLAHRLRAEGVGPEVRVAVVSERQPEMLMAILAVLKAGGAYVPVDPALPRERIHFMVQDAGVLLVLTQKRFRERLEGLSARRWFLDEEAFEDQVSPPTGGARSVHLSHLIYTSGSTGRPKGVAVVHGAAAALMRWARASFSLRQLDTVMASTSISFDISIFELFAPLGNGGRVVLADNVLEAHRLATHHRVTLINTVPSAMAELLRVGELPPSVCTVNLAGEALVSGLAEQVLAQPSRPDLYNLYGPSEDATYSTGARIAAGVAEPVAIGRPLTGSTAWVLDRDFVRVPPGVPGELHLGGQGLARGYLGRPALTAERFVPNPCDSLTGERLYRTGDLVRHRADGELVYLGRIDHQIKLRGFRIELGEVEATLVRHPGVREAAVVARTAPGHKDLELVGYYTTDPTASVAASELVDFLGQWLPGYMVPLNLVQLAELPRNNSGKIDRRALPEPERDLGAGPAFTEPQNETERTIARIWGEALGLERIGVHDNFFNLGGHSLLLVRVHHLLETALDRPLPMVALFEHPNVAALARFLDRGRSAPGKKESRDRGARRREAGLARRAARRSRRAPPGGRR